MAIVAEAAANLDAATRRTHGSGARRWLGRAVMAAAVAGLAGCANFLPSDGPSKGDILFAPHDQEIDYVIADLDISAVNAANRVQIPGFPKDFLATGPENTGTIGVGDELVISVFENVEDGLFPRTGAQISVIVDERGNIFVPYGGVFRARGRTVGQLRSAIRASLEEQTLKPQVGVTRVQAKSRSVSVQGEVGAPGLVPLQPQTNRLLSVLAVAGGVQSEDPSAARITLRRGDATAQAYAVDLYADPSSNVFLRNADILIVTSDPRQYNAFGAVARTGRQTIMRGDTKLIDALSEVGGLNDDRANPTGVFVFRREPIDVVQDLTIIGPDVRDHHKHLRKGELAAIPGGQPVVYQLQLDTAEGIILASEFRVRDGDTIYVTNAPYVAWRKVLSSISPALSTAGSVNSLAP